MKKTRLRRPQTNGKVERFHRILLEEWAYIQPWTSETQRHRAYQGFIHFYNHHRSHGSLQWATFESGDVSGSPEDTIGPMPVVSADQLGTPSLLKPIQAYRWFIDHGGRHGSGWQNQVTRVIPTNTAPFSPYLCAP